MKWPLPAGWQWSPIGSHVVEQVQPIGDLPASEAVRFDRLRGVSNRGGIVDPPFERIRPIKDPRRYVVLRPGYFAYNPMRINVGSVGLVRSEENQGKISPDYVVFSTKPSLLPEYLFAYLKSGLGLQLITHSAAGAIRLRLYFRDLAKLQIPLPPLNEQHRIVTILTEADHIRLLRQDADAQTSSLIPAIFDDMFGDPIHGERFPKMKVGEVGQIQLGRQRSPKYQSGRFTRPYVRVANVFADRIDVSDLLSMDFDEHDFAAYRLSEGDILLNEGQSTELVGRPAMWRNEVPDCCFQNTLIRFRADRSKVEPEYALAVFLAYLHRGEFAKISSKTSNVAHLGAGRFAKMQFPLPPLALQHDFVAHVRDIRAMRGDQMELGRRLDDLRQALLHRVFRGELSEASDVVQGSAEVMESKAVRASSASYMTDAEITAAVIAELMAQGRPLTEFFVQKHLFVLKHHEGLPVVSEFRRKRAGPWSQDLKQKAFFSGGKKNWFHQAGTKLTPGKSITFGVDKARQFLGDRFDRIAVVVADLIKFGNTGLERWTTILKAVLDLRDADKLVTVNTIQAEIDAWPDKREKEAFSEESVEQTIAKMVAREWIRLDE